MDTNNFTDNVVSEISRYVGDTIKEIKSFAPKSELNRRTYKALTEPKLLALADKHGYERMRQWLLDNKIKDMGE